MKKKQFNKSMVMLLVSLGFFTGFCVWFFGFDGYHIWRDWRYEVEKQKQQEEKEKRLAVLNQKFNSMEQILLYDKIYLNMSRKEFLEEYLQENGHLSRPYVEDWNCNILDTVFVNNKLKMIKFELLGRMDMQTTEGYNNYKRVKNVMFHRFCNKYGELYNLTYKKDSEIDEFCYTWEFNAFDFKFYSNNNWVKDDYSNMNDHNMDNLYIDFILEFNKK